VNLGFYSFFTLLGAFSANASMLVVTRFLAGLGIGAELPLVDAYLSELLPSRNRGQYTAWAYTIGFTGVPAAGFLGRVRVPMAPFGVSGWRWMFVIGSIGAAIVWAMRASLPESPRWLDSVGRTTEAEAIVERMEHEARAVGSLPPPDPADQPTRGHASVGAIFRPPYRSRTLMLSVFTSSAVGYGRHARADRPALKGYRGDVVTFTSLTFVAIRSAPRCPCRSSSGSIAAG
jgi:putative MFS transporter